MTGPVPASPPPPSYGDWTVQRGPSAPAIIVLVVLLAFLLPVGFVVMAAGLSPFSGLDPFFGIFCAFFVIMIVIVVAAAASQGARQAIPPPPPIQQPMVPAGMQGPVALDCPNCGAPPSNVDRFGVATCTYCNTRFLVR